MKTVELRPEDYRPQPPARKDYRIALLGCGNIARNAHLRAYREFGYQVVAACDLLEDNLKLAREQYGLPATTCEASELLARDDYEILDLAVHANQRLAVVEQIVANRPANLKAILSQKPLAMTLADAERIVALCEKAGIVFMVNQQARWAPAHRAAKQVLESGALGHVYAVTHFMRQSQDVAGTWFTKLENANIVDHGVHYLDLIRHFVGADPIRVKAAVTMVPGQHAVSPMCHSVLLDFAPERQVTALSHFNNICQAPQLYHYDWYFDGTEGSLLMGHQEVVVSFKERPEAKQVFKLQGTWFPEAFGGSMGELMTALTEGRPPLTHGRDNLVSITVATAAVESGATGRAVELAEMVPA
ncbi:MAG: Gfo/Idh/MocA family oxidoreductase [Armatimonadetes bacterium]|nr:Gfo/Idh/MocA family oxidoreductase [Armatimonadota bacterium]